MSRPRPRCCLRLKFPLSTPISKSGKYQAVKILLVEDSRTIRVENERALVQAGYEVRWAEDGESALRVASEQAPALILLDLLLPRISGMDVLRRLKREGATAQIPVVVVSGLSERNRKMLVAAGADDYREKSVIMPEKGVNLLPKVLKDVICRIWRKRGIGLIPTVAAK
jgi:CheY-like chemotaxis protein